ncbi:hypothetical protein BDQ17DRAFT_1368307 [Cyathus striatus]|nr:hypothetical protein BDQ17DRAFT_1368307 [Cyathus striatus]
MDSSFCSTLALEISQFIFLLRAYALTDKRRANLFLLTAGFFVASSISQASAIATVINLTKSKLLFLRLHSYNRNYLCVARVNVCAVMNNPKSIIGIAAPSCAFDIFIIILTAYNGLARPYQRNAEAFRGLYKDGAKLFLVSFHFAILLAEICAPTDVFLLVLLMSWALNAIMISRLHFKLESFVNLQYSLSFARHSDESGFYL